MTAVATRRPATPYARRLARERGLALTAISGSGPGGRIVAADVKAFRALNQPTLDSPTPTPAMVSAFAASIVLEKVQALLAEFAAAQISLTLDEMLLRAAAMALEAMPRGQQSGSEAGQPEAQGPTLTWEPGGGQNRREVAVERANDGLLTHLHAQLEAVRAGDTNKVDTAAPAILSVRRIAEAGIRPAAMPLLPARAMRLIVSATETDTTAECLLCFDARAVGEDDAASFLARFRDTLQQPIRLLA